MNHKERPGMQWVVQMRRPVFKQLNLSHDLEGFWSVALQLLIVMIFFKLFDLVESDSTENECTSSSP